jgi:2-keto-4-pentenoate hydratase/2-oxohepta-3-ene-1,7-dioic acid hydratase in catechol pathway
MKICTFVKDGARRLGAVSGDHVVDLLAASGRADAFADMTALIRAGDAGLAEAAALAAAAPPHARIASPRLAAPLLPSTILCAGSNYRAHNAEKAGAPLSGREPEFFLKTADCVIGPDDGIICDPILTRKLDCETEPAVVIGKPGRHIPVEDALSHVFGYTVADDVPDPQRLQLRTRINGELRQQADTADMIWTCAELVHFFSINFTLRPGMVILTGTPAGTAWSADPDLGGSWTPAPGLTPAARYCLPGDAVESEIVQIGVLRNMVTGA